MSEPPLSIDIRHPLIIKANELALLTREDGSIASTVPGLGLFYRDTRYLAGYVLKFEKSRPLLLMSADRAGVTAQIELTNSAIVTPSGLRIPAHKLSLRRALSVSQRGPSLIDRLSITSYADRPIELALILELQSRFESIFSLRGTPTRLRGKVFAPVWDKSTLRFAYQGADGLRRSLIVSFSPAPHVALPTPVRAIARFCVALAPLERRELQLVFWVDERRPGEPLPHQAPTGQEGGSVTSVAGAAAAEAPGAGALGADAPSHHDHATLETSNAALAEVVARSLADVALLEVRRREHRFTAAGVPWFLGLFGRDSLLPSIQCLAFNPDLGAHTARALARWQGRRDDRKTREEPGKILHELRVGELANLHEVPQVPSYSSVDSTLLFLIAIARHVDWTGEIELMTELRPQFDAALSWLERKLADGDGYVTYEGVGKNKQPINQSWRDSGTGVLREDGSYPIPPLALVEVQGYAFQAMQLAANLLRRVGEPERAHTLDVSAGNLRDRFLHDFWMPAHGCYCLALEKGGRQVSSITSNTAQVLWTGIATHEHAAQIATRILQPDMFSGWGVRTLSANHVAFDPLAYQRGSVWPFDNSLIVSGLRLYREDETALQVAAATLEAAHGFRLGRLPEFIAGNQRELGDLPVHAPRADPLQAWSAGAVPFMLTSLMGLQVDGFSKRATLHRPLLPLGVTELRLRHVRVSRGKLSLGLHRSGETVEARVVSADAGITLTVERD